MTLFSNHFNRFLSSPISIRLFFVFSFIFLATLVAVLVFLISYQYEQKSLQNYISNQSKVVIKSKVTYFKNKLDLHRQFIRSLKNSDIFQQYITSDFTHYKKESIILFQQIMNSSAEFVSSEEIHQTIEKLGFDYSQGYFFGAPQEDLI